MASGAGRHICEGPEERTCHQLANWPTRPAKVVHTPMPPPLPGVVVDNFSRIKSQNNGSTTMTEGQLQWVQTLKAVAHQRPVRVAFPPHDPSSWRSKVFHLVTSSEFDACIMGVIVLNIFVMACGYWGIEENQFQYSVYTGAMVGMTYIYYAEACAKIIGLGPVDYFSDSWCRFDFFLVSTAFLSDFLQALLPVPPMLLRVLRILRILRILRLLKGQKQLRNLISTIILSFPALINVAQMIALVIFMFSILGCLCIYRIHTESARVKKCISILSEACAQVLVTPLHVA